MDLALNDPYLRKHKIDRFLCHVVENLIETKPEDPYQYIADAVSKNNQSSISSEDAVVVETNQSIAAVVAAATTNPAPKAKTAKRSQHAQKKGGGMAVRKSEDTALWYKEVLQKADLIEDYPVKGCFILRPWAYKIWENIQLWLDGQFKQLGVQNCYFPMFIPNKYLAKETKHLEDFAPEIAKVTKCGENEIEPVAIRPTSETAMYTAFSNWVQSHRDLPLKLNQWCNVVRWEVKSTSPFFRHREFLWQEGHTAFADKLSAEKEVLEVLELYATVYEELMALPCVRGMKTKAETFPGAEYSATVEVFIPATGRALQGGTSHHLGQTFSGENMFDISFQDPTNSGDAKVCAWQNSWGFSTRSIAPLIMVHGDDKGLVLPPRLAGFQVVIVPVGLTSKKCTETDKELVLAKCTEYYDKLAKAGLRVEVDAGVQSPGWKLKHWEMKGVPLLIEVGPRDLQSRQFVMTKRTQSDSKIHCVDDQVVQDVQCALDDIHNELYSKALADRDAHIVSVDEWEDFRTNLNAGKMVLIPFCGEPDCEDMIKNQTKEEASEAAEAESLAMGAKSLCVPLEEEKYNYACPESCLNPNCPSVGKKVERRTLFGRSY